MDNPKHLLLSTASFPVPAEGCTTVSIEMAAIVDGKSRSLRGQGLSASFGPISVSVSE